MQKICEIKYFIDKIAIDLLSAWYFASMEGIKRQCIPTVSLSKNTFYVKLLSSVTFTEVTQDITWI